LRKDYERKNEKRKSEEKNILRENEQKGKIENGKRVAGFSLPHLSKAFDCTNIFFLSHPCLSAAVLSSLSCSVLSLFFRRFVLHFYRLDYNKKTQKEGKKERKKVPVNKKRKRRLLLTLLPSFSVYIFDCGASKGLIDLKRKREDNFVWCFTSSKD
jgi:hypothetical protein